MYLSEKRTFAKRKIDGLTFKTSNLKADFTKKMKNKIILTKNVHCFTVLFIDVFYWGVSVLFLAFKFKQPSRGYYKPDFI